MVAVQCRAPTIRSHCFFLLLTRLVVLGDDFVKLMHNALFEVVQCEEEISFFNGIRDPLCMQVLEQIMVAMNLVDIAQPVNNQFPLLEVDLLILYPFL